MGTVTESTLLLQRDFTEASGDNNSDSDLMSKDLQTEKLILVVYSIIELVGIIGNLYVIIWSLVGSKKTLTKHLLGNVAFAHLIYLLCVPTLRNWKMFAFVFPKLELELPFAPCDYIAPIETLTVSVVVLSFYALGIERFNSASRINKPYSSVPSHVIGRLLVIWLSSILLATPDLLLSRQDSKIPSVRCADKLFANPELSTSLPWLYKFTALYKNSRLLWMMTFFFLLPVIFTALGAVVIALKSAQYKYHGPAGRIKARDERRMNALVIAIYVGFILCWIPHYCYELIREFGTEQGRGILGRFLRIFADMRYYFCAFGMAINPILLGLAGPGFWCRNKSESSQKEPLLGQKSDHL